MSAPPPSPVVRYYRLDSEYTTDAERMAASGWQVTDLRRTPDNTITATYTYGDSAPTIHMSPLSEPSAPSPGAFTAPAPMRWRDRVRPVIAKANVIVAVLPCLAYALTWFVDKPCPGCPGSTYTLTGWEVVLAPDASDLFVLHVRILFGLALVTLAISGFAVRREAFYIAEVLTTTLVCVVGFSLWIGMVVGSGAGMTEYAVGAYIQFACSIACLIMAFFLLSRHSADSIYYS